MNNTQTTVTREELASHIGEAVKLFRRSKPNCAETYVAIARRLALIPGVSQHLAMKVARDSFAGSYQAFCRAQEQGTAPVLFPREGYERRLAAMRANGGRLN